MPRSATGIDRGRDGDGIGGRGAIRRRVLIAQLIDDVDRPAATAAVVVIAPVVVLRRCRSAKCRLRDRRIARGPERRGGAIDGIVRSDVRDRCRAVPATAVPVSGVATIEAVTVTVSVAVAQSGVVFLSQS